MLRIEAVVTVSHSSILNPGDVTPCVHHIKMCTCKLVADIEQNFTVMLTVSTQWA